MQSQDDRTNKTDQPLSTPDLNDAEESFAENVASTFKTFLFAIAGVALLLSIWVLLPMFLTYLSEGDFRAPSEIHPTDTAAKNSQNTYKPDK